MEAGSLALGQAASKRKSKDLNLKAVRRQSEPS